MAQGETLSQSAMPDEIAKGILSRPNLAATYRHPKDNYSPEPILRMLAGSYRRELVGEINRGETLSEDAVDRFGVLIGRHPHPAAEAAHIVTNEEALLVELSGGNLDAAKRQVLTAGVEYEVVNLAKRVMNHATLDPQWQRETEKYHQQDKSDLSYYQKQLHKLR